MRFGVSALRTRVFGQKPSPRGGSLSGGLPGRLHCREDCTGGIYAAPTNNREVSSYRQGNHFRQVCRGRINASRGVCPLHRFVGMAAAGGMYAAPTEYPQNCHYGKTAGGVCPAPAVESGGCRKVARRGQDPSLRTIGRRAVIGKATISGRFVGDA